MDSWTRASETSAIPRSWWLATLSGLLLAAILPAIGPQLRSRQIRCAFDGQQIVELYQVIVIEETDAARQFCCVFCAEHWLQESPHTPKQVLVTDEATGTRIDAANAFFVRSSITSNAPTRDRRHVFRRRDIADSHAESFHGRVLAGKDRPFSQFSRPPDEDASDQHASPHQQIPG